MKSRSLSVDDFEVLSSAGNVEATPLLGAGKSLAGLPVDRRLSLFAA